MDLQRKSLPFEAKQADEADTFEGLASIFNNIDAVGEIVARGAFLESLPTFLENGFIAGLNHDWNRPIGRPIAAVERSDGLYIKARLSDTEHGREIQTLLRDGVILHLSIGFRVLQSEHLPDLGAVESYWRQQGYRPSVLDRTRAVQGVKLLRRLELFEVSPVAVPANPAAKITRVKAGAGEGSQALGPREDRFLFERFRHLSEMSRYIRIR